MALGRNNTYLTAVVLGSVLICGAVLALRWNAMAQRDDSAALRPLKIPASARRYQAEQASQRGDTAQGEADAGQPAQGQAGAAAMDSAAGSEQSAGESDGAGLNASQLRRLAGGAAAASAGSLADNSAAADGEGSAGSGHSNNTGRSDGKGQTNAGKGSSSGKSAAAAAAQFPLELNRATAAQLEAVPGIGPVLAQRILDYRKQHGPYRSLEELDGVKGIGPKTLEQLREYLYIGQGKGH